MSKTPCYNLIVFSILTFFSYSCQDVGIKNGKAAFYHDNNDTPLPAVAFKRYGDFTDGYVELDVTGNFNDDERLIIFMRSQSYEDAYACAISDYDQNGVYDFYVYASRNGYGALPTDLSKIIKYDILSPLDFQSGNIQVGCEIRDGVLNGYLKRQLMVSYVLGSGVETESKQPNLDSPILVKGEVGFTFNTGSVNPVTSRNNEQIQIDNFRAYFARPFK